MAGFVERGGVWVAVQFAWFAAIVWLGRLEMLPLSFPGREGLGAGLMVTALTLGLSASLLLGRSLTPFPKPVTTGAMVERGPYRIVRHPIYTAVILGMVGIALRAGDWIALSLALGLLPFFYAKSAFEERHLAAQYPAYEDYRRRVPRGLIPGLF
ncbi:MAG: methyltransferase family protein [Acidimicrobiia bacterium]